MDQVIIEHRQMQDLIASGGLDRLDTADRARAQRLATTAFRGLERADRLIDEHLTRAPPEPVMNILRLGVVELAAGEAAHGVVADLVEICGRNKRHGRLKGLVNAVLRKLSVSVPEAWDKMRAPKMQSWLRDPLSDAWGAEAMDAMDAAHFAGAPLDLTPKSDAAAVAKATGGTLLPTGSVRVPGQVQVSALSGFDTGDWWVQDAAAALPARLVRGQSVLDLCAAPGGKTMQLAAAGKTVTALDDSVKRVAVLEANLKRTGLKATLEISDARKAKGSFDAILLDAPCSATGTLRRHPDLPFAKDGSDFASLINLQAQMLDHAISLLKPGNQLVFCTCSLLPDEGEVQVEEALKRHTDLEIDSVAMQAPWIEDHWRSQEGGLRLRPDFWPELGGMDGFYIAALQKRA
jgi:16S rRNA (cytosine967-C5)-methyltransferase